MRQKIDRTGETAHNTQGRLMKIVEYNSSQDMVVEFEDGERVSRVTYQAFKRGNVRHPKDKATAENRIDETAINTQGRFMKIVEYNSAHDMVVEFEDGERVSGVTYRDFKKGNVRHPKDKDRTGETAHNTQRRLMKIVEYNNSQDMVVEFEDGERVSGVSYNNFKKGNVLHPKDKAIAENRVGETAINTQGLLMKIVEYHSTKDMIVEFVEDGVRVNKVQYDNFKKGYVRHPKDKDRTGETAHNTKGLLMKIVEYNSAADMVVEFVEDGERVSGVQYYNFKRGNVRHPKEKTKANYRVGKTATNTKGLLMKIVEYNSSKDMVVEFVKDGERVNRVQYDNFKKGNVLHPKDKVTAENRVGKTAINTQGLLMKIVEYHSTMDMVVEFVKDGERVSGVAYKDFKKGKVRHPKDKATAENRVGKTAINTQGLLMKIVEYNSSQDVVVEFVKDGERVSGVQYDNFKRGNVRHPKDKATAENRVGETATATNGQTMTIVEYLNHMHIMVQFPEEDLPPIKTTYRCFRLGQVKNPHFPMLGKGQYKTFQTEYAYTTPNGEVYFYCECQRCGWKKNMKADEAINCNHVCEEKEVENYAAKDR